jgi:His-Xaa-Ser system radical SAM maturase HxsC
MLLTLSGRALRPLASSSVEPFVVRVTEDTAAPSAANVLLVRGRGETLPPGFRAYLVTEEARAPLRDTYVLAQEFRYLADGDVVRLDPQRQALQVLYRRMSRHNTLLVTEQCDNYCVMCSQPPKNADDSWRLNELIHAISLMSPDTESIGITGGEPALLGDKLVRLLTYLKEVMPRTAIHVLSNGRRLADDGLARSIGELRHPNLMFGIPLYSALPEEHDYVVQAKGAFDETVHGILNLKQNGVRVELRTVLHRETYAWLPSLAAFVARNLLFVDHVAVMGLELTGFAKTNVDALWIDPAEYIPHLHEAIRDLVRAGMRCSIYNLPLCVLPAALRPFARKSISDWKNSYLDECKPCVRRDDCAGFFATGITRRSSAIAPFT